MTLDIISEYGLQSFTITAESVRYGCGNCIVVSNVRIRDTQCLVGNAFMALLGNVI